MSALLSALGLTDEEIPTIAALYGSESEAESVIRRLFREDLERRAAQRGQEAAAQIAGQAVDKVHAALPTMFADPS